jgi:YEATS domain-containing protein 4
VIHQSPFVIEESGWGEFDVQMTMFFVDPNEKPLTFYHHLKLFLNESPIDTTQQPLVNEFYDELVRSMIDR